MDKITILGDLICDYEMLKHSKQKGGYNFDKMFSPLVGYFDSSSYVVLNLETVIANMKYTNSVFSFNNPESLLKSLKKVGIDAVSLANNHILDRGVIGVNDTINYLKKYDIDYFGVDNKKIYIETNDTRVCLLGYTDSTNYHVNKCIDSDRINLLKPNNIVIERKYKNIFDWLYYKINPNIRININHFLGKEIKPIIDKESEYDDISKYINHLRFDIDDCCDRDYYTIMYSHMGGQFNINPGKYTLKMIRKFIDYGVDSVVVTHPHIIQRMDMIDNKLCFNSIGGMIISPDSKFVIWDTHPEFSIAVHYYFDKNKLVKVTCSFLICVRDNKSYLKVYPFYDYYNDLINEEKCVIYRNFVLVYNRLFNCNKSKVSIEKEYLIKEC